MTKFLQFILFFSCTNLVAQNYRTVNSASEEWFIDPMDHINAIHPDSAILSGQDSIVWNYPNLREDFSAWRLDTTGPSWVGRYSIYHSNGDEVYFNSNMDSIFFKTYL